MQQIRRFEEERKAWEDERCQAEERERALTDEKMQFEMELSRLQEEMERLRSAQASSPPPRQGPTTPSAPMRSHHESQLALMAMIDDLRRELRDEQARSRSLEQKASEAEKTSRRLAGELDRAREGTCSGFMDLDCSVRSVGFRQLTGKASGGSAESGEEHDELSQTLGRLETSRKEVISLEDESLRLREDLNNEKQKVIELKRAAHSRAAQWKRELQKITEELAAKQKLEEEVAQLRAEQARNRKEFGLVNGRELAAKKEAARLQRELEVHSARGARPGAAEELEILSNVVGGQLVAVEQELTRQMKKSSQLFEHFLRSAHEPLAALRRSCRRIASSGTAGRAVFSRAVPSPLEAEVQDLGKSLARIIELLRYAAEVLEGREQEEKRNAVPAEPPLHKRDLPVHEAMPGCSPRRHKQESKEHVSNWIMPFETG